MADFGRVLAVVTHNVGDQVVDTQVGNRTVTDLAVTSGSTTVTSATAAFTSADVGRAVTGSMQIPAGAVIASVTNSTTAVLSASATGTATGRTVTIAGVAVLQLDESSEFPSEGGTVSTDVGLLDYGSVDADADTMTLAAPLPVDLPDESRVELWDPDRGAVVTETIAYVVLEGSEDDGDPYEATVRQSLRAYLPDGIRSGPGEVVEVDTESEQVIDVPGRTPQLDGQAVWNPHSFRTFNGQTVSNATHEKLLGWTDVETDGVAFLAGVWTVTIPAWYDISTWVTWAANATGRRRLRILINGVAVRISVTGADPDIETYSEAATEARLVEGDTVEAWVYQTSGAGLAVSAGTFSIRRTSL